MSQDIPDTRTHGDVGPADAPVAEPVGALQGDGSGLVAQSAQPMAARISRTYASERSEPMIPGAILFMT